MRVRHCPICGGELTYISEHVTVCTECEVQFNVYDSNGNKGVIICPEEKK